MKPWPWADTWPIARLRAIDKGVDLYVLADASGRSLAFGPGYVNGTAAIGEGNTVLAGHRDTHFAFLRDLQRGDEFAIQTADGRERHFQLNETHIIDSRHERCSSMKLSTPRSRCSPAIPSTPLLRADRSATSQLPASNDVCHIAESVSDFGTAITQNDRLARFREPICSQLRVSLIQRRDPDRPSGAEWTEETS